MRICLALLAAVAAAGCGTDDRKPPATPPGPGAPPTNPVISGQPTPLNNQPSYQSGYNPGGALVPGPGPAPGATGSAASVGVDGRVRYGSAPPGWTPPIAPNLPAKTPPGAGAVFEVPLPADYFQQPEIKRQIADGTLPAHLVELAKKSGAYRPPAGSSTKAAAPIPKFGTAREMARP